MKAAPGIVGVFSSEESLSAALEELRQRSYRDMRFFSPLPIERLIERPEFGKSPVRFYTLIGGLLGFISGLSFTIWTALSWPLRTGGKPIVSLPPYLVITFELTILFGGLFTVAGLLIHTRLPRMAPETCYDARFSVDRFGIFVPCESSQEKEVKQLILAAGAEEVRSEPS